MLSKARVWDLEELHRAQARPSTGWGAGFQHEVVTEDLVAVSRHHLPLSPRMPASPFCPGGPGMAP